ncbi:hypothetical protein KY285_001104 [Solanum tuberosum]|nr:hypothetical protein KY285_001104 [Solanum tuberosum]
MSSLADVVEIQSWTHLFMNHSPILHEEQVREFYYMVEFTEDGSLNTQVWDIIFHLNEERLGEILNVPREGIRSMVGQSYIKSFAKECGKLSKMNCAGIPKKLLKGDYQLLFEFVNKVLLPITEKRTVASVTDFFLMEALSKFDLLNLPTLILEHMHKTIIDQKGKHDMEYGYFLTKVFKNLEGLVGEGIVWTVKQSFAMNTLVECECVEGRTGHFSKMFVLEVKLSQLKHKLEEMTMLVSQKDAEIELLKAQMEGPSSAEVSELKAKNEPLLAQNAEHKEKLIKSNDAANDRLSLVIQSLTRKPFSS